MEGLSKTSAVVLYLLLKEADLYGQPLLCYFLLPNLFFNKLNASSIVALSFSCFGFPKFESEKRFYDKQLNIELKEASFLLEDLKINKELETKLLHGVEKSVTNDYYFIY